MRCFIHLFLALRFLYFLFDAKKKIVSIWFTRKTSDAANPLCSARCVPASGNIWSDYRKNSIIMFYTSRENLLREITIGNVCDDMSANAELISATTGVLFLNTAAYTKSFLFSPSFYRNSISVCVYFKLRLLHYAISVQFHFVKISFMNYN